MLQKRVPLTFAFVTFLATSTTLQVAPAQGESESAAGLLVSESTSALTRVISIGASLSDGFGNGVPIHSLLKSALPEETSTLTHLTSSMFFMNPNKAGPMQLDRAVRANATLVIGADYLFWFGYGHLTSLVSHAKADGMNFEGDSALESEIKARTWMLRLGFKQLERLDEPGSRGETRLVISDFPDMTGADPNMLHPSQIPSADAQVVLNAAIREWSNERDWVLLLPMSTWVSEINSGDVSFPPRSESNDPEPESIPLKAETMLLADRLHPSKIGAIIFGFRMVNELREWLPSGDAECLKFDPWKWIDDLDLEEELQK